MKSAFNVSNPSATAPIKTFYEAVKNLLATGRTLTISPYSRDSSCGDSFVCKRSLTKLKILKETKAFAKKPSEAYLKRMSELAQSDVGIRLEQLVKEFLCTKHLTDQ